MRSTVHEALYQQLRASNAAGWGGAAHERRREGWKRTVDSLMRSRSFPRPGASVLELGCGAGGGLIPFAQAGYQVCGVDIAPTAIEWARENFAAQGLEGEFQVGNVCALSFFGDQRFDAVLDGACFHCIIGDDRRAFLREVRRVLRPGGFLLISSMAGDPRGELEGIAFDGRTRCQLYEGRPYRYMARTGDLIAEVSSGGFDITEIEVRKNSWWDHVELWAKR